MNLPNSKSDEGNITIIYTSNNRLDQQSKRRIRVHAATWSRTHGPKKADRKQTVPRSLSIRNHNPTTGSTGPQRDKEEHGDTPGEWPTTRAAKTQPSATLSDGFVLGTKFDAFNALPQLRLEQRRPEALAAVKRHMSTVLGEEFVSQNIPLNSTQSAAMYTGSLLLTYARNYALTGKLSGPDLLELKGEVINVVNNNLRKTGTSIDLESLYAMFVLGTPVVCLTTTRLPSSVIARRSLFAAQQAVSPAAVEDSLANEIALRDHFLHRQTVMRILIDMGPAKLREAKIGRQFLAFFILLGNLASLVSPTAPVFGEADLYPPPRTENDVKTSPIWHSPLYCPEGAYISAAPPRNSTEALTTELCRNVQSWLTTFPGDGSEAGEEDMLLYRQHCRDAIALFRPSAVMSSSESGYIYECCRLVAQLMLRAETLRCSLNEAVQGTAFHIQLKNALQKTNLFDLWGPKIGLLYWVLLVFCTSIVGNQFDLNPTTVLLNFLIGKIATSDYHVEVGLRPLQKLKWFKDICLGKA